jgi:hypothetical protein
MKVAERASQVWAVLAWVARNRQLVTYADLSKLVSVTPATVAKLLDPIQAYCKQAQLPALALLAVKSDGSVPGSVAGALTAEEIAQAQAEVQAYDWLAHGNPQADKLELALAPAPEADPA